MKRLIVRDRTRVMKRYKKERKRNKNKRKEEKATYNMKKQLKWKTVES